MFEMNIDGVVAREFVRAIAGAAFAAALVFGCNAHGAVLSAGAGGFEVSESAHIAASPDKVYQAITTPSRWWDSAHTFSKDAANLSLDPKAGGCWCEHLPDGGSAEHMVVVWAAPGKALRLHGTLGPLQGLGAAGALTFKITPSKDGSDVELHYAVGGYSKDGLEGLAAPVDQVLGSQLARLKAFIEATTR